MLVLDLTAVPKVLGIYGKSKNLFPANMSFLHPEAAEAFAALPKAIGAPVRVSDMFRTAEQSMLAMQQKAGVQPPGYSAHNYGLAIDVDVDSMLTSTKAASKKELDALFATCGWYCHRRDGRRGFEDWHYNFLGAGAEKLLAMPECAKNTAAAVEARIVKLYGKAFKLKATDAQSALTDLRLYSGALDGKIGPRTTEAIKAFQRTWKLDVTGELNEETMRTLAYVACAVSNEQEVLGLMA